MLAIKNNPKLNQYILPKINRNQEISNQVLFFLFINLFLLLFISIKMILNDSIRIIFVIFNLVNLILVCLFYKTSFTKSFFYKFIDMYSLSIIGFLEFIKVFTTYFLLSNVSQLEQTYQIILIHNVCLTVIIFVSSGLKLLFRDNRIFVKEKLIFTKILFYYSVFTAFFVLSESYIPLIISIILFVCAVLSELILKNTIRLEKRIILRMLFIFYIFVNHLELEYFTALHFVNMPVGNIFFGFSKYVSESYIEMMKSLD